LLFQGFYIYLAFVICFADYVNEPSSTKQLSLQHSGFVIHNPFLTGPDNKDYNPLSSIDIDYPDFNKDTFQIQKQISRKPNLSSSDSKLSKQKQLQENKSQSRLNLLHDVADELTNIATSAAEKLTKTTQPFVTSSINVFPTKRTPAALTKRGRNYFRCDTTQLTIQAVIEYLTTGKICGYSVTHMRFGLGR